MEIRSRAHRHPPTTGRLLWAALCLCIGVCGQVQANCIATADPEIRELQLGLDRDASATLKDVTARLHEPGISLARLAGLYSVKADALGILELSDDARAAASTGLKLAPDVHDPVHLELLSALADNTYDGARLADVIAEVEQARRSQAPGSVADTCLLIVRGLLEYRQDRGDLAIATLSKAYHATDSLPAETHMAAASTLSVLMRAMGDYSQALVLNQEEIDWATPRGATMRLSVARFMRGQILKLMGKYETAIDEYAAARKLSVALDDSQGIAYADLRICESHLQLGDLKPARLECENALRIFFASQSADLVKESEALLARIDLREGRPDKALAALNRVLDQQGADLAPLHVAAFYESRSQANAALRKYREAYDDLRVYTERYVASNDVARYRQAAALRARFETDREIASNAALKRELTIAQEQSKRQARELKLNTLAGVVSVCVIALLVYFLLMNLRYRRQLTTLASQDALTGLPNRRRIAELAAAAVQTASITREPLTIAVIDMDHFKALNDRCGHAAGDQVLRDFARASSEVLRECDSLGRWGGEEFLLLMPGATIEVAMANVERLRTLVFGIRLPPGVNLRVSVSVGLAEFDSSVKTVDEFIARADAALYTAKDDGRDLVRIADGTHITGSHWTRRATRQ
jgi:diguanylate cyclase (GGDEF)-like protein